MLPPSFPQPTLPPLRRRLHPVPPGTPTALAKINLEVRRGPAEIYDLIGYLPEGAVAEIVSQDETGQWWQIKTSLGNKGLGWIKAGEDFSEAGNTANVSIALVGYSMTSRVVRTISCTLRHPSSVVGFAMHKEPCSL